MQKTGDQLKPGDIIHVWWKPGRDQIVSLRPYTGPFECQCLIGARVAEFALNKTGMTIEKHMVFETVEVQHDKIQ